MVLLSVLCCCLLAVSSASSAFRSFHFGQSSSHHHSDSGSAAFAPPQHGQDCVIEPGNWGPCSKSCGGGHRTRHPVIVSRPSGYGARCPDLHEEQENCNQHACPVDCEIERGHFGPCSATCGYGTQTKIDVIIEESRHGGRQCPPLSSLKETRPCRGPPCPQPVDCQLGYTQYGQCSKPCGGGVKSRTAYVIRQALNGGAPCPTDLGELTDEIECNKQPCSEPKDCEFFEGQYGECSAKCGNGVQKAVIYIVAQPEGGGKECPSELVSTRPCNAGPCPEPRDCVVQWEDFSRCSKSCQGGTQTARGRIVSHSSYGGAACPDYSQLLITRTCNNFPCDYSKPRDCEVVYGEFSECSKTCDGGFRYQQGFIKTQAELGGLACPSYSDLVKREPCNPQPCNPPVDCKVERGYWSDCSKSCGGGSQERQLTILAQPAHGGHECPSELVETRVCNPEPCEF